MPVLYVKDKSSLEIIRIEESFSSLVWTERYQSCGDFVLDIPLSKANFDVYRRGNYVILDESTETMVIESVSIDESIEDPILEVSGRSLSLYLERRINASRLLENYAESIKYTGTLKDVVTQIMNDDVINPFMERYIWKHKNADGTIENGYGSQYDSTIIWRRKYKEKFDTPYRKIPNFSYSDVNAGSIEIDKSYNKLMTIYDILESLAKKYVFGFRVRLSDSGGFVLETYKGQDHSSNQNVLDPIIFNPVMDNISYVNYFEDQSDYKNVALSYSDGSYSPVEFNASFDTSIFSGYVWVLNDEDTSVASPDDYAGLDRIELAVDARSSASVSNYDPSDYYYPEEEEEGGEAIEEEPTGIIEKVAAEGKDAFENGDYDLVKTSEGAVDPLVRYTFEEDYFLGDIVELSNDKGVVMIGIIDEVVRSYDADGFIVTPNFKNIAEYDYGEEETE